VPEAQEAFAELIERWWQDRCSGIDVEIR